MNPQFVSALTDILIRVAVMAITALAVLAFKEIRDYVRVKVGAEKFDTFKSRVEIAIRALEQVGIIQKWDGAQKKQQATVLAHQIADALKLNVSDDQIDMVIEGMVQTINTEIGKYDSFPALPAATEPGA